MELRLGQIVYKGEEQVVKVGGLRPLIMYRDMPTAHLGGSGGMLPQKILEI